jgi:HD-GYP domain-containing protein (c-di-GMP phosphodiesterase class II)
VRVNDNPFFHRGPILDAAFFFDRTQEIADTLNLVADLKNCCLVGSFKSGKTSSLLQLQRQQAWRDRDTDACRYLRPFVSMEGLGTVTPESLFHALWREVLRCPGGPQVRSDDPRLAPSGALSLAELQNRLDGFTSSGTRVVFLVDEFDQARGRPEAGAGFRAALAQLASRPDCAFVLATEQPPDFARPDGVGGAVPDDLFTVVRLRHFTRAAVADMVTTLSDRAGRLWDVSADRITDWTGGHPYLVQVASSLLWRRSGGAAKALYEADYDYVYGEFVTLTEGFCHNAWRRLAAARRETLLDLAAGSFGSNDDTWDEGAQALHASALVDSDGATTFVSRRGLAFVQARLREREHQAADFLGAERPAVTETIDVTAPIDKATIYRVVRALVEASEARDTFTRGHADETALCAVAIARRMRLAPEEIEGIEIAARLHDVGKIGVSDLVLMKPDKLTDKERDQVKTHVLVSAHILDALNFPWEVKPAVRFHHERIDGSGYPDGLMGDEIPLSARVLAVADVFTAMTAARTYRTPHSRDDAIAEVTKHAGTKYDPQVVSAFIHVLESGGM